MEISGPRLRSLLRRAEKVANVGKFAAAATLYRQLTEEAPEMAVGWLGLAAVTSDTVEKETAVAKVLALEPDNEHAQFLQAQLKGETQSEAGEQFPIVPSAPSIAKKDTIVLEEMAKENGKVADKTAVSDPSSTDTKQPAAEEETEDDTSPAPDKHPDRSARSDEDAVEFSQWLSETAAHQKETEEVEEVEVQLEDTTPEPAIIEEEVETATVCYRHSKRETALRCYSCERYICSQCAIKTPVGYRCPVCVREAEDVFFNATLLDYLVAPIIALPLSLIAGFLVLMMGSGFFMLLIIFFLSGVIGGFIGRAAKWSVSRRRGRYLAHIVAACVAMGILIPGLPVAVAVLFGNASFWALIGPGLYLFIAVSAAFYQMK